MDIPPENSYPQLCLDVGLTRESCTAGSARQLAAVCKGLRGKTILQLFVQIHTHSACARMHAHFAASYRDASRPEPLAAIAAAA